MAEAEQVAHMTPAQRREEFLDAMETGQSEPKAELALAGKSVENPSKGLGELRLTKDLSGKFIYGGLGLISLCAIFLFARYSTWP
jgi:hypothetical protein